MKLKYRYETSAIANFLTVSLLIAVPVRFKKLILAERGTRLGWKKNETKRVQVQGRDSTAMSRAITWRLRGYFQNVEATLR